MISMISTWSQVFWCALLFGFTSWAGTRIAHWQNTRDARRKFEGSMRALQDVINQAGEAAEKVRRARQSGPDDRL